MSDVEFAEIAAVNQQDSRYFIAELNDCSRTADNFKPKKPSLHKDSFVKLSENDLWLSNSITRIGMQKFCSVVDLDEDFVEDKINDKAISYMQFWDLQIYEIIYQMFIANTSVNAIAESLGLSGSYVSKIINNYNLKNHNNYLTPPNVVELKRKLRFYGLANITHKYGYSSAMLTNGISLIIAHNELLKAPYSIYKYKSYQNQCTINKIPGSYLAHVPNSNIHFRLDLFGSSSFEKVLMFTKLAKLHHRYNINQIRSIDQRIEGLLMLKCLTNLEIIEIMCHYDAADEINDVLQKETNTLRLMLKACSKGIYKKGVDRRYSVTNWNLYRTAYEDTMKHNIYATNEIDYVLQNTSGTVVEPCASNISTILWCKLNGREHRWLTSTDCFNRIYDALFGNCGFSKQYDEKTDNDILVLDTTYTPISWIQKLFGKHVPKIQLYRTLQNVTEMTKNAQNIAIEHSKKNNIYLSRF